MPHVSSYATDNSSAGLAWTERYGGASGQYGRPGQAPGKFTFQSEYGGRGGTGSRGMETFFSPGWGGGKPKYEAWRRNLDQQRAAIAKQHQDAVAPAAAAQPTMPQSRWHDEPAAAPGLSSTAEQIKQMEAARARLEQPIQLRSKMDASDTQFRRATMCREVDREYREARWNANSDIGAA